MTWRYEDGGPRRTQTVAGGLGIGPRDHLEVTTRTAPATTMPSPARGLRRLRGWRRWVVLLVIASFLLIEAYGLCSTYGRVVAA